ncbi:MAG: ABC transporter substrate-binding protein [Betaproteobacteria bacterium]
MHRRSIFLFFAAACLHGFPVIALAQRSSKVYRIALFDAFERNAYPAEWQAFRLRLAEPGYLEAKNLVIEARWADNAPERMPSLARELVALRPDLIVANATPSARAAMQATSSVPIVVTGMADPVKAGLVASLARPGGNVTGSATMSADTAAKRFEVLREILPQGKRFALIGPAASGGVAAFFQSLQQAARQQGLEVRIVDAPDAPAIERAFDALKSERPDALIVSASSVGHRQQIAELAERYRIPVLYGARAHVEAGGLMSLAPDFSVLYRRAAEHVHRILQGTKPADIPVEQANIQRLSISLRAAKAIGLAVPQSLLLRADEVIE